jgi:chromosome segregation ATPase
MFEIAVVALLAVIAGVEIYRAYMGIRPTSKKDAMKGMLLRTRAQIWELEFKVFKAREIREDIRQQYDQMLSRIQMFQQKIDEWPADGDQGEKARVADDKTRAEAEAARYLRQMQMLDAEVDGIKPSSDNPNGQVGISEQIDGLREVEGMIKDMIKTL